MTDLERAIKHIKTRADAWAVKEVTEALQSISERLDKALSQEPCDDAISQNQSNACSILDDECPYPYKHCWGCSLNYQYELAKLELENRDRLPQRKSNADEKHIENTLERQTGKWIPVSERLPEDLEPVNITWVNHNPERYYEEFKDKPFTATGHYYKGRWYWYSCTCQDYLEEYGRCDFDEIDMDIEVIAWMPLPKPYEPQKRGK